MLKFDFNKTNQLFIRLSSRGEYEYYLKRKITIMKYISLILIIPAMTVFGVNIIHNYILSDTIINLAIVILSPFVFMGIAVGLQVYTYKSKTFEFTHTASILKELKPYIEMETINESDYIKIKDIISRFVNKASPLILSSLHLSDRECYLKEEQDIRLKRYASILTTQNSITPYALRFIYDNHKYKNKILPAMKGGRNKKNEANKLEQMEYDLDFIRKYRGFLNDPSVNDINTISWCFGAFEGFLQHCGLKENTNSQSYSKLMFLSKLHLGCYITNYLSLRKTLLDKLQNEDELVKEKLYKDRLKQPEGLPLLKTPHNNSVSIDSDDETRVAEEVYQGSIASGEPNYAGRSLSSKDDDSVKSYVEKTKEWNEKFSIPLAPIDEVDNYFSLPEIIEKDECVFTNEKDYTKKIIVGRNQQRLTTWYETKNVLAMAENLNTDDHILQDIKTLFDIKNAQKTKFSIIEH